MPSGHLFISPIFLTKYVCMCVYGWIDRMGGRVDGCAYVRACMPLKQGFLTGGNIGNSGGK